MAKALMVGSIMTTANALASADELNLFGFSNDFNTESNAQASATEGCTFSALAFNVISGGSGTNNLRFRDAGADGNQLATGAGTGIFEDAVNSDTLSAADLFNLAYTDTGSNSVESWIKANVEFASGHGCFTGAANFTGIVFDAQSATRFIGLAGSLEVDGETTEANVGFKARGYDVFEALQVRVTANARTNDSIFRNRINGGNGSAVITFGAGVTGLIIDDGLADAIGDGQLINASITLDTGLEDLSVAFVVATLKSSTSKQDIWAQRQTGAIRAASATEEYFTIGGHCNASAAFTEAQAAIKPGFAGVASNLRCYLSANTYSVDGTLKLYQNGSAVITTPITLLGGAAWYENTSDTVTFDADDVFSYEIDEGTTGSITVRMIGMTFSPAAGGSTSSPGQGSIVFTGLAPASTGGTIVESPGLGTIVFTGLVPTSTGGTVVATPALGTIVFTGLVPTSSVSSSGVVATPGLGTIVFTGLVPTAVSPLSVAPGQGSIVFTGLTPTVAGPVVVTPDKGAIVFTGLAPTLSTGIAVGKGLITFTGFTPVVATTTGIYAFPATGQVVFTGLVSTVTGGVSPFTQWTEQFDGTSAWTEQFDGTSQWTEQFDGTTTWAEN